MQTGSSVNQFDALLVPQGAEYQAVCRGLKQASISPPPVFAIPIGATATRRYLQKAIASFLPSRVLLMGLCGSLQPQYSVGDVVLYNNCLYSPHSTSRLQDWPCDPPLTAMLAERLGERTSCVKALTSDRFVASVAQKRYLGQLSGADVVDMEGFVVLEVLSSLGTSVAMLRVVSDDSQHDIPDLSAAIAADGTLKPLPLALEFVKQPLAATRLIRGSLKGLQVLQSLCLNL
jgi:purine-nucleoside phosphorylase